MACGLVLHLLLLGVFHRGLSEIIETQQNVKAVLGKDAHLHCQLTQSKDVLQVTWQKVLRNGKKNLATYSKKFGAKVNPPFPGKVDFLYPGLQNCSIVIRNVTKQDESCYHCLFNTAPDGAFTATTCLKVYEQYEPVLDITRSNSTEEPLVSCSATGRPAPEVTLIVSERDLSSSQSNTVSFTNPNGTVTVTTTAVLSGFHGNSAQVGCGVRHFSGAVMQVFKTIPENNQASAVGFGKQLIVVERRFRVTIISVVTVAAFLLFLSLQSSSPSCKPKNCSSDRESDKTKTQQTPPKQPQETEVPFITQENEQIRQRSSPLRTKALWL